MSYIYQRFNVYQFRDAFMRMGRENQFSYEGLGVLFEYLEDYAKDCGEGIELDVIALCCDCTEYKDLAEFNAAQSRECADWDEVGEEYGMALVGDEGAIVMGL